VIHINVEARKINLGDVGGRVC